MLIDDNETCGQREVWNKRGTANSRMRFREVNKITFDFDLARNKKKKVLCIQISFTISHENSIKKNIRTV